MANLLTRIVISAKDEASAVFGSLQAKVAAVGAAIGAYFTTKLFGNAISSARDFEAAMSAVQAAAGASGEELAALRAAAEEAGATTRYTSVEAAGALENLAKAGLSAADAVEALPAVLDLAAAGGVGLGEASDYISKAVAGMGLSFADAGRVADVLAMGANASNTSVQGLADALSYAAPLANSLGLNIEQTVAIIGKFADAGIDASRAGTALNSVMAQFADPASKFRRELADAGITTTDFDKALRQLAAAGPAGAKAINAVGMEAGPALRGLLNQGISSLDALKAKLDESAGSARSFAQVMSDNLDGAAKSLGSAWDALLIKLGTPVLDTLRGQVNAIAERLREFVSNGTADRFGVALKSAFESAGKWAADFFGKIDFTKLASDMQAFAARAGEVFDSIGAKATAAGNATKVVYGVMAGGVHGVITAWNSLIRILYNVQEAVFRVAGGFNRAVASITFGDASAAFARLAKEAEVWADRSAAAARLFAEKSGESFAGVVRNAELVNEGFAGLSDAAEAAATATTAALDGVEKKAKSTAERIAELRAEQQKLSESGDYEGAVAIWEEIDRLSTEAANSVKASGAAQRGELAATKASVAELRAEYDRLFEAGEIDAANAVWKQLQQTLRETTEAAKVNADEIEAAYQRLGVASTAQLKQAAENAKRDFEMIRDSGTASAEDIAAAFKSYAEVAVTANNGVASEALKAQAAQLGLKIEADEAGKVTVQSMKEAAAAIAEVGDKADESAGKVGDIGDAAEESAEKASNAVQNTASISADMVRALEMVSAQAVTTTEQHIARANQVAELVAGMAESATRALNALAAQQERLNSSGQRGLEDLRLRWLELNGTEEEVERYRQERETAQIRRQIALIKLDMERAALNQDHAEADRLREEIRLYEESIQLLEKIHSEEDKQRKARAREEDKQRKARAREEKGSGGSSASTGSGGRRSATSMPSQETRMPAGNVPVLGVYRVELKTRSGSVTPIDVASPADATALLAVLEEASTRS